MSPVPVFRDHTKAVIEALEAVGLQVGDGVAPKPAPEKYAVVYSIPGPGLTGSLANPDEDAVLVYQVTCVGRTTAQAQWVVDKSMTLLAGFEVPNRRVARVELEGTPGLDRDDDVTPHLFYATARYRVKTTPA